MTPKLPNETTAALNRSSSSRFRVAPSLVDPVGLHHRPALALDPEVAVAGGDQVDRDDMIVQGAAFERRAVGAAGGRADDGLAVGRARGEQGALLALALEHLVHVGDGVAALEQVEAVLLVGAAGIAGVDIRGRDLQPAAQPVGVERPAARSPARGTATSSSRSRAPSAPFSGRRRSAPGTGASSP